MQTNSFILTLEDAYMISPHVKHFIFQANIATPFSFEPGQFITLHWPYQDKTLKRSYSLANAPTQTHSCLEFAAGFVADGPGSAFLFALKPGDTVEATGPYGRLTLKPVDPKRYILIATSTGITPYRSMIPELKRRLDQNPSLEIMLLQGVQTRADLLYHDEFKAFAEHERVTYLACLSQEISDLNPHEFKGYVQHAFSELSLSAGQDLVYLCGNPSMVDDAFNQLKEKGFEVHQIVREKYISR